MSKSKIFGVFLSLCLLILSSSSAFAKTDKAAEDALVPEWIFLNKDVVPSNHNPNGTEVVYGFDNVSARIGKSNGEFEFILAKVTKAKNEIEVSTIRMGKDKSYYRETQKECFYLDGTLKSAENVDPKLKKSLSSRDPFYNVRETWKANDSVSKRSMEMPELPEGFNKFKMKAGKPGFENWLCFLDDRTTGLNKDDEKQLRVVTYAYNPADRLYYKGIVYCTRTGPTNYLLDYGTSEFCTYEDKLLKGEEGLSSSAFINDQSLRDTIEFYYMFYKER